MNQFMVHRPPNQLGWPFGSSKGGPHMYNWQDQVTTLDNIFPFLLVGWKPFLNSCPPSKDGQNQGSKLSFSSNQMACINNPCMSYFILKYYFGVHLNLCPTTSTERIVQLARFSLVTYPSGPGQGNDSDFTTTVSSKSKGGNTSTQ